MKPLRRPPARASALSRRGNRYRSSTPLRLLQRACADAPTTKTAAMGSPWCPAHWVADSPPLSSKQGQAKAHVTLPREVYVGPLGVVAFLRPRQRVLSTGFAKTLSLVGIGPAHLRTPLRDDHPTMDDNSSATLHLRSLTSECFTRRPLRSYNNIPKQLATTNQLVLPMRSKHLATQSLSRC